MKLIPSLGEVKTKALASLKRFPIVISWAIIAALFVVVLIETDSLNNIQNQKVIMVFVLGISWLIASRFFLEQFKKDREWISLVTIAFLIVFYFTLSEQNNNNLTIVSYIRFWMYIIIGHIFVLVAPFMFYWNKSAFFNYVKGVGIAVFRSAFFSLIIFGGISLALLAVENLFDFEIKGELYFELFVICLGIVNTWIYLSDFPKNIYSETIINYAKPLEVLVKYILIPLVLLYVFILYAYSLKIIFQWSLPKGWVSYLVIALSFLGFIVQMLINPVQKTIKSRLINIFHPWFYYLLLPLITLLFVAIFRRISEYGFTENRYLVLALAIWILGMTLYMFFSKKKQIRYFSLTFVVLFVFISIGFWSLFNVSINSQLNRFEISYNNLEKKDFKVTYEEKNQFEDIIEYLYERDQLNSITPILGFNPNKIYKDLKWKSTISNKISDTLNITVTDSENLIESLYGRRFYSNLDNEVVSVSGYDYFKNLNFTKYNSKVQKIKDYSFFLDKNDKILRVFTLDSKIVQEINLNVFIENLLNNSSDNRSKELYEMTLIREFENFAIKLIFSNLSLNSVVKNEVEIYKVDTAQIYIFIKEKQL